MIRVLHLCVVEGCCILQASYRYQDIVHGGSRDAITTRINQDELHVSSTFRLFSLVDAVQAPLEQYMDLVQCSEISLLLSIAKGEKR